MVYRDNALKAPPPPVPETVVLELPAAAVHNFQMARAALADIRARRAALYEKQIEAGRSHDQAVELLNKHRERRDPLLYENVGMWWATWQAACDEVKYADELLASAEIAFGGASLTLQDAVQARIA